MNEQIELLIESAEMWITGAYIGTGADPLCKKYRLGGYCFCCPVLEKTKMHCCIGTPYDEDDIDSFSVFGEWLNCLAEELIEKEKRC